MRSVTGVTRPCAQGQEVPSLGGMVRRVVGVAVGLVVVGALGLALDEQDRDQTETQSYSSVETLAGAIKARGIGCARLSWPRGFHVPGEETALCEIGSASITLHAYEDPAMLHRLGRPSVRSGVSWVVGPNWLVATMSRPAALQVSLAIGGDLIP
jgi:hypothetical protein